MMRLAVDAAREVVAWPFALCAFPNGTVLFSHNRPSSKFFSHDRRRSDPLASETAQYAENNDIQGDMKDAWRKDVFPAMDDNHAKDGDEGINFFRAASRESWLILVGACVVLCLVDALCLRRAPDAFL